MKHGDWRMLVIGALSMLVVIFAMGQSPMTVKADGLQFPDGTVQTTAAPTDTRRAFYLTDTPHLGSTTLTACEQGFHMASLWEILDVSNLRYAREVADARTGDDTGQGPPNGISGWVRTGWGGSTGSSVPGLGNCQAWESNLNGDSGTTVALAGVWDDDPQGSLGGAPTVDFMGPWLANTAACDDFRGVWCVEGEKLPIRGGVVTR